MHHDEQALSHVIDWPARREELYPILERQARLYTMGDSSSLPVETVEELLRSIRFCVETNLLTAGSQGGSAPLSALFEAGQRDVWQLTEEAKTSYRRAKALAPAYGSIACRDTLRGIGGFFSAYDLRFFAHQIPCDIDYPLCLPVPESLEGVRYIGEYLRRMLLEHRFCGCFPPEGAIRLLRTHHPEYRELILNLFDPILTAAVGLALLNRNPEGLVLDGAACDRLYDLLHPWEEERAQGLLHEAVNLLCVRFRLWDTDMRRYLMAGVSNLAPLLQATSRRGYGKLFSAPFSG